ncbi:transcriptional regulator [Levilactobacillus paucivorans]|uniref:Transcriptional regulator n=1 Tax=Levilactobacillus paucivorans TaxID=616990 RepID=A0A0R2LTB6_9LACO|nr:TetR/AcrR family transcriptional regulator [Levilactobacillus paucivorans]KRO04824.1 transcriptional regulator [Levilactobacillus paucivorans]
MPQTTRERILIAAEHLIMQTGHAKVTLSEIAQQLGMTHAALYKHFKNKQDLWAAVATAWFNRDILSQIQVAPQQPQKDQLHDWLWAFVSAKKQAATSNPQMFALNTRYVDNHPQVLRQVLTKAYREIDRIMGYHDPHYARAETILATFTVFTLPAFRDTWKTPDYQQRFELIWSLIENGL